MFNTSFLKEITHSKSPMNDSTFSLLSSKLHFYIMFLLLIQSIPVTIYRYFYFNLFFTWVNFAEMTVYIISLTLYFYNKKSLSVNFAALGIPIIYSYLLLFAPIDIRFNSCFWFYLSYMLIYLLLVRTPKNRMLYILFCMTTFLIPGILEAYSTPEVIIKVIQVITLILIPYIISGFIVIQDHRISDLNFSLQNRLIEKEKLTVALEKKNEELVMFSHMMSHDLKSPLNNIKSFSTLLKNRLSFKEPQEKKIFGFIENSAEEMNSMITDLLAYSQIEFNKKQFEIVSLNKIIETIKYQFQFDISQGKVIFNISDLPSIYGDENLLKTLFQNLISNGIKYQPKDSGRHTPTITISSSEDEDHYHIYVTDNGIGMSKKNIEHLFDPFRRFHSKSEYEGTGLGMSICKKVMTKHNATISVDHSDSFGSVFKLSFLKD